MELYYKDDNGDVLHKETIAALAPSRGDAVWLNGEIYSIDNVVWYPQQYRVIVLVSLYEELKPNIQPDQSKTNSAQIQNVLRSINEINKRQDVAEKQSRNITESVVRLRKHINKNPGDKKDGT